MPVSIWARLFIFILFFNYNKASGPNVDLQGTSGHFNQPDLSTRNQTIVLQFVFLRTLIRLSKGGFLIPTPSEHGCCDEPGDEPSTPGVFPDADRHHGGAGDSCAEAGTRHRQIRPQGAEEETEPGGMDYWPANGPLRLRGMERERERGSQQWGASMPIDPIDRTPQLSNWVLAAQLNEWVASQGLSVYVVPAANCWQRHVNKPLCGCSRPSRCFFLLSHAACGAICELRTLRNCQGSFRILPFQKLCCWNSVGSRLLNGSPRSQVR